MIVQKGHYISLRKSQGMLFENLRSLKMIVPIPLNTQIKQLSCHSSINWTNHSIDWIDL